MAKNNLNRCDFIGHLGSDVDFKSTQSGTDIANFNIACNWKSKEKEGVEWIRIVAIGKLAKICSDYLKKGSHVFVSGRMRTNKWQDKDGIDRYTTEIIANELQMLDYRNQGDTVNNNVQPKSQPTTKPTEQSFESFDDDLPF